MIAVAKIGGHQAIVQVGDKIEVDKLSAEVGKTVHFETLLVSEEDGKNFQIGTPFLNGIQVEAKIIEHSRGAKIRVFKMKPRKRYRRLHGHHQDYTVIEITAIGANTAPLKKATTAKKDEAKTVAKLPSAKTTSEKKPGVKKTVAVAKKVVAEKKPAVKKVAKSVKKK
jgi:large subunit ribosomal protein L21